MIRLAILIVLGNSAIQGQAVFEVASIKPSAQHDGRVFFHPIEYSGDSVTMRNVSLSDCITWAYHVPLHEISIASGLDKATYDILAKASAPVSVAQLRLMAQQLLADRFKLRLHREKKVLPVYELVVAKGGPKLPPENAPLSFHTFERYPRVNDAEASFVYLDTSMADFSAKLSLLQGIGRRVVDKTGIAGYYNFAIKSVAAPGIDPSVLFSAIPEQLGLRLVSARDAVEMLIVDSADVPSQN